tara:strand:- start:247 stop:1044 length:798 start_codon:yes stop_codon:yes gene_type:complete
MITYNHERYIEEAIRGVLIQKTDFKIEFIISNDASTDGTHEIIEKYIRDYPNINFKYYYHPTNLGMIPNFIYALQQCKGKYIAFCEGDDYWTDPLKLQKQVDFLEENADYNICFHNVSIHNQELNKILPDSITRKVNETTNVTDLVKGNFIHTPSVVLRNNFNVPKWFSEVYIGDWSLYVLQIKDKKIMKMNEIMAVYRVSNTGEWSTKSKEYIRKRSLATKQIVYENAELNNEAKEILRLKIQKKNKNSSLKNRIKNMIKMLLK